MDTNASRPAAELFQELEAYIEAQQFTIAAKDFSRPWGGFFVLQEQDADRFIELYFPGYTKEQLMIGEKLSPKFLVVAPNKRLSWQYHYRRAEIWRVLQGPVQVATNLSNEEVSPRLYQDGEVIVLQKGERHRLIGADNYGIVTEIWQHTDPQQPSDEDDIVRLQDDFGR